MYWKYGDEQQQKKPPNDDYNKKNLNEAFRFIHSIWITC